MAFMTDSKASLGMYSRIAFWLKTLAPKYSDALPAGLAKTEGLWLKAASRPK